MGCCYSSDKTVPAAAVGAAPTPLEDPKVSAAVAATEAAPLATEPSSTGAPANVKVFAVSRFTDSHSHHLVAFVACPFFAACAPHFQMCRADHLFVTCVLCPRYSRLAKLPTQLTVPLRIECRCTLSFIRRTVRLFPIHFVLAQVRRGLLSAASPGRPPPATSNNGRTHTVSRCMACMLERGLHVHAQGTCTRWLWPRRKASIPWMARRVCCTRRASYRLLPQVCVANRVQMWLGD